MPTLTNTQGALVAGCSPNDQLAVTVSSGTFSLEYPIGTIIANGVSASTTYTLGPGQFRLTTTGSVTYALSAIADTDQQVSSHASGRASAPVSSYNGAGGGGALGKPADIQLPVLADGKSRIKTRFMVRKTGADASSFCQLHIGPANGTADPNILSGSTGTQFASTTPYPALYELEIHYKSGGFMITGNRFVSGVGQTPISWEFTGTFVNDGTAKLNIAVSGTTAGNTYDLVFLDVDIQVFQ